MILGFQSRVSFFGKALASMLLCRQTIRHCPGSSQTDPIADPSKVCLLRKAQSRKKAHKPLRNLWIPQILLFWPWNKQTFRMFSPRDLPFRVLFTWFRRTTRAKDHRLFFIPITHKSTVGGTPIYKLYVYGFGGVLIWNRVIDFAFSVWNRVWFWDLEVWQPHMFIYFSCYFDIDQGHSSSKQIEKENKPRWKVIGW